MNNKKGEVLSVYWFAILLIIAGGIVIMTYAFYGTPYDIREIENRVLINKIADCISFNGVINSFIISNGQVKIESFSLDKCNLNFGEEVDEYFVQIEIYKFPELVTSFAVFNLGNNDLASECSIQDKKKYNTLSQCHKEGFYSVDDANNQYVIKITSAVRKLEQNVK